MNETNLNRQATVFIIEDNKAMRDFLDNLLKSVQLKTKTYYSAQIFLNDYQPNQPGCLLLDLCLPDIGGLELCSRLKAEQIDLPIIVLTSEANASIAVTLMKAGIFELFEKPPNRPLLLECIQKAIRLDACLRCKKAKKQELLARIDKLTQRQHEVMVLLLEGKSNKMIAEKMGISPRTLESHHTHLMKTMQTNHLIELAQIAAFCGLLPKSPQLICSECHPKQMQKK
jgi:FixJ family two-component response regulator